MASKKLLYTIRNYYENRSKTGIIITLSAQNERGEWSTIRAYVPYKSRFADSATAEVLEGLTGASESAARVEIPKRRNFEDLEE